MSGRPKFEPGRRRGASPTEPPKEGLAIASIVIGAICILLIWVKFIVIFLAPIFMMLNGVGILLAISNRKRNELNGHATIWSSVGLIVNIVSLVLYTISLVACIACASCICAMAIV